eukprot:scaffold76333_cov66-Phaeocystis_antarctica.AAC.4
MPARVLVEAVEVVTVVAACRDWTTPSPRYEPCRTARVQCPESTRSQCKDRRLPRTPAPGQRRNQEQS